MYSSNCLIVVGVQTYNSTITYLNNQCTSSKLNSINRYYGVLVTLNMIPLVLMNNLINTNLSFINGNSPKYLRYTLY